MAGDFNQVLSLFDWNTIPPESNSCTYSVLEAYILEFNLESMTFKPIATGIF